MGTTSKPLRILITDPDLVEPLKYLGEMGHTLDQLQGGYEAGEEGAPYSIPIPYDIIMGRNCWRLTADMIAKLPQQTLIAAIKGAREIKYVVNKETDKGSDTKKATKRKSKAKQPATGPGKRKRTANKTGDGSGGSTGREGQSGEGTNIAADQ